MRLARLLIAGNNLLTRLRSPRVRAEQLLLLAPHCLQAADCTRKLTSDPQNCTACGGCQMPELLNLSRRYGCRFAVAAGGRQAVRAARAAEVRVLVVVACQAELAAGVLAVFPKPVYAVVNRQPHGPCRATVVAVDQVEAAFRRMLRPGD